MRRLAPFAVLPCSVLLFIALAPIAAADETTPPTTTTTMPPPTTSAPTPTAPRPAGPRLIQPGVTIGGLLVGGLTAGEARKVVEQHLATPITVVAPSKSWRVPPRDLGALPYVSKALTTAVGVRSANFVVPLRVDVSKRKLERFLAGVGKATDRKPVEAELRLRNFVPVARKSAPGRRLEQVVALQQLSLMLRKNERAPFTLPYEILRPKVTEDDLGQVIVIKRDSRKLLYFNGLKLKRAFRIATGQPSYPTPIGEYEIINKQRNPTWYPPPDSEWARGAVAIPPGPGNPLGTRWMGISAPYVGIHGTPDSGSIGTSASHGCVRMLITQVEWLFERVDVGTPVFIVRA